MRVVFLVLLLLMSAMTRMAQAQTCWGEAATVAAPSPVCDFGNCAFECEFRCRATVHMTPGHDVFIGQPGVDYTIYAGGGFDFVCTQDGHDTLYDFNGHAATGAGNDLVFCSGPQWCWVQLGEGDDGMVWYDGLGYADGGPGYDAFWLPQDLGTQEAVDGGEGFDVVYFAGPEDAVSGVEDVQ